MNRGMNRVDFNGRSDIESGLFKPKGHSACTSK
jgi:hypothetical protein